MRALKGWVLGVGLSDKHRLPPLHFKCVFMCGVWGRPCIYKHTRRLVIRCFPQPCFLLIDCLLWQSLSLNLKLTISAAW